jgi:hypothetical protein
VDDGKGIYEYRYWQRVKVAGDQILARAQKSLDKIQASSKEGESKR